MTWFTRTEKNITTPTTEKRESPDDMWFKNPRSGKIILKKELEQNCYVCVDDQYHVTISPDKYFRILFDDDQYTELNADMRAGDPLKFVDTKAYSDRVLEQERKKGIKEAARTAYGQINGLDLVVVAMDFGFIGGSMGSVVGQKISLAIDHAIATRKPLMIISQSGGARMMEASFSLMQMAKTSAKLALLSEAGVPYISLLTNPTTGGVTASYAMLGDLNIAEPQALIGFAGPRVVRESIGKELPKGFQTAEFLLEHGFVDFIVDRRDLKDKLTAVLNLLFYKK
ncbi:MAG: acetyl-CoA carboxylase carboxyltransferase subunit beta [Cytophagales bacterium]|nr:MAG: acetyl-CoA carboxylase carboxyltransferase subunit beta [Cytophagales bacterium]TAF60367.1 MAG: acetyl-CoA carboxylase carboxyltransferase subunit beta [Cytophagales bacterium]